MQIIHSNIQKNQCYRRAKFANDIQRERSLKWVAIQNRRDNERVIKEHAEAIKEIQQVEPGWFPLIEL